MVRRLKKIFCLFTLLFLLLYYDSNYLYSVANSKTENSGNPQSQEVEYSSGIEGLDEEFFNSETLGIGVFFSNSIGVKKVDENGNYITDDQGNYIYETDENGNYITKNDDNINHDLGLYVTNNGKDFTYIGETGISGRDPNIFYKNGVFYMATTKGASYSGKIIFNLFKSTDLVNWTLDDDSPYSYRYEPADIPNNIYHLPATTWSPKFMVDGDKIYLLISVQKFSEDGGTFYYVKGNDQSLIDEGLVKSEDGKLYCEADSTVSLYNSTFVEGQKINPDIGILVKETPVLDENRNTILDENKKIITEKKFVIDTNGKIIQLTCAWYNYPVFDTYIAEVTSLGTDEEQKDLNTQNLTFGEFKKVNFKGYTYDTETNNTYLDKKYSMLGGYLLKNNNNDTYKYTMYTKMDPYGTVQRWVAKTLDGEWIQADDRYYVGSNSIGLAPDLITCSQTETLLKHTWRLKYALTFDDSIDDSIVFQNHYEGSCLSTFGNDTFIYTDHYIINNPQEVTADKSSEEYLSQVAKVSGIYYSQLDKNGTDKAENEITDLGISTDHARYNNLVKITPSNTEMRPTVAKDNQLRNGCVFTVNEDADKETFKNVLKQASTFNTSYEKEYADISNNKITVVLKSNRALKEMDENTGWKYASQMQDDKSLNQNIKNKYKQYNVSIPYSIDELYIYKTFDSTASEQVTISDMLGNETTTKIDLTTDDVTPPTINNVTLSNSSFTNQDISIKFSLSDSSGVCKYKVQRVGGGAKEFIIDPVLSKDFEYGGIYRNGTYKIYAWDTAGNMGESQIIIENIDRTPPNIENIAGNPTEWTGGNVTLTVTAQDIDPTSSANEVKSGLADMPYSFDGGVTWQAENTKTYEKNTNGIVIQVKDKAGNISSPQVINIANIILLGDINEDEVIDVSDLLMLKRHLVAGNNESWILTEKKLKAADINEDNVVDVSDLLLEKRLVIKQNK